MYGPMSFSVFRHAVNPTTTRVTFVEGKAGDSWLCVRIRESIQDFIRADHPDVSFRVLLGDTNPDSISMDFARLVYAPILVRGPSSFNLWAALANQGQVYSPPNPHTWGWTTTDLGSDWHWVTEARVLTRAVAKKELKLKRPLEKKPRKEVTIIALVVMVMGVLKFIAGSLRAAPATPAGFLPLPVKAQARASSPDRRFFVGGNWKANGKNTEISQLVDALNSMDAAEGVDVVCAPPTLHLVEVSRTLRPDFLIAAQDVSQYGYGAHTGDTPAEMLVDSGIEWTIVGHSERRQHCGETDEVVGQKTSRAIDKGLKVVACVGERLDQREAGVTLDVLQRQLQSIIDHVGTSPESWKLLVVAYEPVWAIGTGRSASPEDVETVHASLRQWLAGRLGATIAHNLRIIYGGSVNDANCEQLADIPDVDGFLVGGASLNAAKFGRIISSLREHTEES
ncbi:triosephosphate isomerase [Perkinsus olseni]|uniref:triose-phosphate isomerase n=1 Tax=Perkinsus olseni TaxID=32597 RepID=A0A7J6MKN6_PEROL|nr:triosephosphate isomerase [Perkinsus olseni]